MINIAILNFGSKYNDEIPSILKKAGAYPIWCSHDTGLKRLQEMDVKGIVLTGSMDTVYDGGKQCKPEILNGSLPVLGICYGQQLMSYLTNGVVEKSQNPEHGTYEITASGGRLFRGILGVQQVSMSHNDYVSKLGEGFVVTAYNQSTPFAACENVNRKLYGVQFHPEREDNTYGLELFKNFIDICKEG